MINDFWQLMANIFNKNKKWAISETNTFDKYRIFVGI